MISKDYQLLLNEVFSRYSPVSKHSLSSLFEISEIEYFKKDETILTVGTTAQKIYILCQGAIVSYFLDAEGSAYHKNIFLEGDMVGSIVSSLTQLPSQFALHAIEDTTLISMNYHKYRQLIWKNEDLKDFYISYLEKNWVIDKEKREIAIVMKSAAKRYLELLHKHPRLDERIPLTYIASHLGITPTQLSRIRKKLKK